MNKLLFFIIIITIVIGSVSCGSSNNAEGNSKVEKTEELKISSNDNTDVKTDISLRNLHFSLPKGGRLHYGNDFHLTYMFCSDTDYEKGLGSFFVITVYELSSYYSDPSQHDDYIKRSTIPGNTNAAIEKISINGHEWYYSDCSSNYQTPYYYYSFNKDFFYELSVYYTGGEDHCAEINRMLQSTLFFETN